MKAKHYLRMEPHDIYNKHKNSRDFHKTLNKYTNMFCLIITKCLTVVFFISQE